MHVSRNSNVLYHVSKLDLAGLAMIRELWRKTCIYTILYKYIYITVPLELEKEPLFKIFV